VSATEAKAKRAVELSTPAPDNHAYLIKKAIQPHGVGLLGELYKDLPAPVRNKGNVLVIPMQDVNGKVLSCQFIAEDGSKAYMAGQKRKGGFYFIKGGDRLWICEGFATGASLHEDTGDSVACAFDTGGLMPVTGALTALYGTKRRTVIMADDDWKTDGNPGFIKARAAAHANGIKATRPLFGDVSRTPKDTDFNDMVRLRDGR
jgi:putative DNA primase/helicase